MGIATIANILYLKRFVVGLSNKSAADSKQYITAYEVRWNLSMIGWPADQWI